MTLRSISVHILLIIGSNGSNDLVSLVSDCGINAHKHCKDLVVMECRSKASVACNRRLDSLSSNGKFVPQTCRKILPSQF